MSTAPSADPQTELPSWYPKPLCCWCHNSLIQREILGTWAWTCPQDSCFERQLRFAMLRKSANGKMKQLIYLPVPRQTEAHEAVELGIFRRVLYGGAAGGGKSRFLRWLAYQLCLRYPGFNILLLRRTWPELEQTHIQEAVKEAALVRGTCTPSSRKVTFENDSLLRFGHCQDDKDMAMYLSTEYDAILIDELVTFLEDQYLMISSRARTSRKDGWNPMVLATTNPGGPGAHWVREMFIDKTRDRKRYPAYNPDLHMFIPALLDDNPYINADYVSFLMDLPPELREAYRFGRWDIFPGQFFKEFRRDLHVRSLQIPSDLPRLGGLDWGYLRPGVMIWAVTLPEGQLYIEREYVFRETVAKDVAQEIRSRSAQAGVQLSSVYCDPAMQLRDGQTGESIYETMQQQGLGLLPSKNERVNGWQRLRHWLRPLPSGSPALIISPDCEYLARTLPQLISDRTKPEDVDTTGEDHAADALRYLVMSRPHPMSFGDSIPEYSPDSAGALFEQLRLSSSSGTLGRYNVRD